MPIARFEMPDGRIARFEVPDGTTPEQAQAMIAGELAQMPAPAKIGREAFPDALRDTLRGIDWGTRNIAGAGTALSNLWERAKQAVGQGDQQAIEENRVLAEEAPVGSIAGNVALFAPTAVIPGANTYTGAALTGATIGALQPTLPGESTLRNMAVGAGAGAAGKAVGDAIGRGVASARSAQAARQAQNAPRDATLKAAQEAGYVVPPSQTDAGIGSRLLEGLSGKYKTNQLAGIKNQRVTDYLARKAVGLSDDAPLTSEAMQSVRRQAYQAGYEPVASVGQIKTDPTFTKALDAIAAKYRSPARSFPSAAKNDIAALVEQYRVGNFDAGDAIQAIQVIRDDAAAAFRSGNTGVAKAGKDLAKALEDQIERGLFKAGGNGAALLKGFRDARTLMAKAHTIEDAIIEGGGNVNAVKLAQRAQAGKPMSGELKTIGEFANVFRDVSKVPQSGHANPLTVIDMGVGGLGAGMTNPYLLALPGARIAARYGILSPAYQRLFAGPDYGINPALALSGRLAPYLPGMAPGAAVTQQ